MRHLLTGFEFSQDEYLDILDTAAAMKKDPKKYNQVLAVRNSLRRGTGTYVTNAVTASAHHVQESIPDVMVLDLSAASVLSDTCIASNISN